MAQPFLGEIKMVGFNFAPRGWALCNGQILAIAQNAALFSLLGTYYGGNGTSTFALPNFQGRIPMHQGNGPGLTPRVLGEMAGTETVTLINSEMPQHTHLAAGLSTPGTANTPNGNLLAGQPRGGASIYGTGTPDSTLAANTVGVAGGSQPHNNMPPYLVVNFVIATAGIYPTRN